MGNDVERVAMDIRRELTRGEFLRRSIDGTHAAPIENAEAMAAELLRAIPEALA